MDIIGLFRNMTSEDVQRYVRIALQWLAAFLVTHGTISPNAQWIEPLIGVLVGISSLIWTLYGNRINAKLAEIAKADDGKIVVVTTPERAANVPATNVISNTGTTVITSPGAANAIPMDNVVSISENKVVKK